MCKLSITLQVPVGYRTHMLVPREYQLPEPEETFLMMRDNVRVHLWLFAHLDSRKKKTVIFFHGNAGASFGQWDLLFLFPSFASQTRPISIGNMSFRLENFRQLFRECDVNVLAVEYRGYGLSEGYPEQSLMCGDAEEVLLWLTRHERINPKTIFVLGRSIGGAVAFQLAKKHEHLLAGLIVENSFLSVPSMVLSRLQ